MATHGNNPQGRLEIKPIKYHKSRTVGFEDCSIISELTVEQITAFIKEEGLDRYRFHEDYHGHRHWQLMLICRLEKSTLLPPRTSVKALEYLLKSCQRVRIDGKPDFISPGTFDDARTQARAMEAFDCLLKDLGTAIKSNRGRRERLMGKQTALTKRLHAMELAFRVGRGGVGLATVTELRTELGDHKGIMDEIEQEGQLLTWQLRKLAEVFARVRTLQEQRTEYQGPNPEYSSLLRT
ncbi:hypothetical protein K461DRAFT_267234 [Myriangium duriaei CBS 260.36]|uniref:DUF7770 domain-containing protein n=1 Tax=Myriangium duriaei CBS 260.36 TaxID=1168546 RepID=A0A9P4J6N4_9PEZI|nr:hypothetical protein K461DRAFT_267234 [Myriangium duriaei CBS 260.36]